MFVIVNDNVWVFIFRTDGEVQRRQDDRDGNVAGSILTLAAVFLFQLRLPNCIELVFTSLVYEGLAHTF